MEMPTEKPCIIYLDQFGTSSMFDSGASTEWNEVRDLIKIGASFGKLICPMSLEHFLETSKKDLNRAIHLNTELFKLSGGYSFKPELLITSQLMISEIRKNNITIRTFIEKMNESDVMDYEDKIERLGRLKDEFNAKVREGTSLTNELRKIRQHGKSNKSIRHQILKTHSLITINKFIGRLSDLLAGEPIRIRPVQFQSGDIPNWIDSIIYLLTNKHKITKKETQSLIIHLKRHGFNKIATLDIRTSLAGLIGVNSKQEDPSDQIDLGRISTGLPLSDIFLTDKKRKNEIVELGLDVKYDTQVLSGTKKDLVQLVRILKRVIGR